MLSPSATVSRGPEMRMRAACWSRRDGRIARRPTRTSDVGTIDLPDEIQEIGWKAQFRLYQLYRRFAAAGMHKVTTAIARELIAQA